MANSPGKPIIYKLEDPTGLGVARGRCLRAMRKLCDTSAVEVKAYIKRFLESHQVITNYEYEVYPDMLAIADREIKDLIYRNLFGVEDSLWSVSWWMNQHLEYAFEKGTQDSLQTAKNISPADVVGPEISMELRAMEIESVMNMPEYRRRLNYAYGRTFNDMVGFSDETAEQASRVLGRAITSGQGYRAVAKELNKVFDDMKGYRALRIVRTEMNNINAKAYTDNTKYLNENVYNKGQYEVAVMHLSALAENTRPTHAARHGHVYTPDEQQEWWDTGSNRINCQCSITDILRNKRTGEVLQTALHKKALEQGRKFLGLG